ncbi:MAG TPA: gluconate 5-dehydrogenase [Oceanospirillaceae bacterium]|nr:gluconate 5-dehydrogenase [Oceanospirillaceae bacterium]
MLANALQAFSLVGKVAMITGASSGIGAQQAKALGAAGAKLVLVARSYAALLDLQGQLQSAGIEAQVIAADLMQTGSLDALVADAQACFGKIDILCNTAGVNYREAAAQVTSESWDNTQTLNVKVPFMLAQKLVPAMQEAGWGRIINVASLQSSRAFANGIAYGASKGAVSQLTRAMAEAWSSSGIACNAIAPGFFPTALTQPVFEQAELSQQLAQQTAIGRNGELQDLDGIMIFLASPAADYITGQVIHVDGGFSAK